MGVRLDPQHGQEGMRQQGQGDVAMPALPGAHLVVIQPHLPFGRFDALLDGPPLAEGTCDLGQRRVSWGEYQEVGRGPSGLTRLRRATSQRSQAGEKALFTRMRVQS